MKKKSKYQKNTAMSEDEIRAKFNTEDKARKYYEKKIWGSKPKCPFCGTLQVGIWKCGGKRNGWYKCYSRKCNKPFTVRMGTIMQCTRIPLRKWLLAEYYKVTARKGISSLELSKKLGVAYKTALFLHHRLGFAVDSGNFDYMLGGLDKVVQSDETYAGGRNKNRHADKKIDGSGPVRKGIVLGMVEQGGRKKAVVVSNVERDTILREINKHIRKNTLLATDEGKHYIGIQKQGYKHRTCNHSAKVWVNGKASTNSVESVWALLKRGFYGIYHKFSMKHLQKYVAESVFRLNEGQCKYLTMERIDAIIGYSIGKRLTYRDCVGYTEAVMVVPG
ncbi:MAG: IS1595 family transposase [Fibromonadales bacterium]|nr:IS1595 family transposase [Fibromonadales bacterium]